MPRSHTREPDFDEGLHPEGPSAADLDRFGDEFTTCRECGHRFYDQAEICPRCGFPVEDSGSSRGVPLWAVGTALVVIIVIILAWTI